jgi:hypothetical protein
MNREAVEYGARYGTVRGQARARDARLSMNFDHQSGHVEVGVPRVQQPGCCVWALRSTSTWVM